MGLVVDLVPNHMTTSDENPWWVETLRHGPRAEAARVFDIDWEAGGGKVRLPVLGAPLDQVADQVRVGTAGSPTTSTASRWPPAPTGCPSSTTSWSSGAGPRSTSTTAASSPSTS